MARKGLNAPKKITFWITVVLAVIGLLLFFFPILGSNLIGFIVLLIAYIVLALANLIKGM